MPTKNFYHQGLAFPFDQAPWTQPIWEAFVRPNKAPDSGLCIHCGIGLGGEQTQWHCRSCTAKARRRLDNPSFTGRFPIGFHEVEIILHKNNWLDRFRGYIDTSSGPDGCHTWTGMKIKQGYGVFRAAGRNALAHRLSFLLAGGSFAHPVIMHACDNPSCVNPAHLRGGTRQENMADMHAKGRHRGGSGTHLKDRERHPRAKRIMTPKGEFPSATLAAEAFGITKVTVSSRALRGDEGWSYL